MEGGKISFNKYLPVALLYFFFNGLLLPLGLLYTTLLTPFFLLWLYRFPSFRNIYVFFLFFIPFLIAHLIIGVRLLPYFRSSVLLFSVFVFALAVYQFLDSCTSLRVIFRNILIFNGVMVIFAVLVIPVHSLRDLLWYSNQITPGVHTLRLRLLTYEPSYYATLLVPLALYYYLKMIILRIPDPGVTFLLVTVPFLMAFSFGGILGLGLALLFTLLIGYPYFFSKTVTLYLLLGGMLATMAVAGAFLLFPHSVVVVRLNNILEGNDSSFRGRTYDSFFLGWHIAALKSLLFGCGPGQVRELGLPIFRIYYTLPHATADQVAIPNAVGDTLAPFGLLGVAIRMFLEIYFFFRTRVWRNYYRLSLFLFMFIYQFTGSFLTNIAEYVIWVMAFHAGIFPEFNKENFQRRRPLRSRFSAPKITR
ncbi:MAG TPA: hypothetical protein VL978_16740 [Puia sp.]|nr:hypothetical protein [Puia sp.]